MAAWRRSGKRACHPHVRVSWSAINTDIIGYPMHKSFWNIIIHLIWLTPLSCPCNTFASFPKPPFPKQRHWSPAKLPPPPPPIKEHIHGLEEAPWRQNYPQIQELIRFFVGKTPPKHHMGGWKFRIFTGTHHNLRPLAKNDVFGWAGSWKVVGISLQMPDMFVEKVEENPIKNVSEPKAQAVLEWFMCWCSLNM